MKATLRRPLSIPQDRKIKNKRLDRNGGSPLVNSSESAYNRQCGAIERQTPHIFHVSEQRAC